MKKIFKKQSILRLVAALTILATLLPVFAACDFIHTHTPVEDPEVPATCSQTGLTKGSHCSVCGKPIVEQKEIPMLAHTFDDEYDKDCNVCGADRPAAACKHSDLEHHAKKNATCEVDGNIEYYYCTVCKTYFADKNATSELDYLDTIIHAQDHTPVEIPGVAPTYTSAGWTSGSKCSTCGEILREREPIDPLDPEEGSVEYYNIEGISEPIPVAYYSYIKHEGLVLPTPKREHYDFSGWYIYEGGVKKYIEAIEPDTSTGAAVSYKIYADWTPTEYTITRYITESNTLEAFTYTVEDIDPDKGLYIPGAPENSGLHFDYWVDARPDVVKEKLKTNVTAGLTKLRIDSPKDAGNKIVTAMWKTSANKLVSANDPDLTQEWYDDVYGQYYFIYHIGTYDNVIINQLYSKYHDGTTKIDEKETVTTVSSETKAETITQSITNFTTTIETSSVQREWSAHYNKTYDVNTSANAGAGISKSYGNCNTKAALSVGVNVDNKTEAGFNVSNSSTQGSSVENGSTASNSFSTSSTIVTTKETDFESKLEVAADSPMGYYCCAETATVYVFAIIRYDIAAGQYYMNMHSVISAASTVSKMYSPTSVGLNPKFEGMNYDNIPVDEIANSTYVTYTGDDGKTNVVRYEEKTSIKLADSYSTDNGTLSGITIPNTIKEFTVTGEAEKTYDKIDIVIGSVKAGEELKLNLKNFNAGGSISASKDAKVAVKIHCSGDNALLATSTDGAIYGFDNVTVSGSGNLTVYGKDGANATADGARGNDGGVGISVGDLVVDMSGNLNVYGGNGGNGADTDDYNLRANSLRTAGSGGNGADAISCVSCTLTGNITIQAGKGGNGGYAYKTKNNAGIGGNGGSGGHGIRYTDTYSVSDSVAVSGGSGGSGGGAQNWNFWGGDEKPGSSGSSGSSYYKA